MSKLTIADLTNEVELSSAAMSAIGGGMSCLSGAILAQTYVGIGQILEILGDNTGAAGAYGKASGLIQGSCKPG
jgi:hypothetical protein